MSDGKPADLTILGLSLVLAHPAHGRREWSAPHDQAQAVCVHYEQRRMGAGEEPVDQDWQNYRRLAHAVLDQILDDLQEQMDDDDFCMRIFGRTAAECGNAPLTEEQESNLRTLFGFLNDEQD